MLRDEQGNETNETEFWVLSLAALCGCWLPASLRIASRCAAAAARTPITLL